MTTYRSKSRSRASTVLSLREVSVGKGSAKSPSRRSTRWQQELSTLPPYDPEADYKLSIDIHKRTKRLSFWSLFRYASWCDLLLIFIGTICAALASICPCWELYSFGRLLYGIVEHHTCTHISNLTGEEIDVRNSYQSQLAWVFVLNVAVAAGSQLLLCFLFARCFSWAGDHQMTNMRIAYFDSTIRKDMAWFDTNLDRDFAHHMTDEITKIRAGLGQKVGQLLYLVFSLIFLLTLTFYIDKEMSIIYFYMLPIYLLMSAFGTWVLSYRCKNESRYYSSAGQFAEEMLSNIKTVKIFAMERASISMFCDRLKQKTFTKYGSTILSSISSGFIWLFIFCTYALIFWEGGRKPYLKNHCDHHHTFGPYYFFYEDEELHGPTNLYIILIGGVLIAVHLMEIPGVFSEIQTAKKQWADVSFLIKWKPRIDSLSDSGKIPKSAAIGKVELSKIQFRYPRKPDVKVLSNVSLIAYPGQIVSVVGNSFAGKSTMFKLLSRLYDPCSGHVFLDGHNVENLNVHWYRTQVSVMDQEKMLFNTTIEENIRFGKLTATTQEIRRVAKDIGIHDEIMKLPQGYGCDVGHKGVNISEKLKTYICFARVMLRRSRVIILDDPLYPGADEAAESNFLRCVQTLRESSTVLIASRKCDILVKNSDCIYVLQDGVIKEYGTHLQLIKKKAIYYKMLEQTLDIVTMTKPKFPSQLTSYRFAQVLRKIRAKHDETSVTTDIHMHVPRHSLKYGEKKEFGVGGFQMYFYGNNFDLRWLKILCLKKLLARGRRTLRKTLSFKRSEKRRSTQHSKKGQQEPSKENPKPLRKNISELAASSTTQVEIKHASSLAAAAVHHVWNIDSDNESIASEDSLAFWDEYYEKLEHQKHHSMLQNDCTNIFTHIRTARFYFFAGVIFSICLGVCVPMFSVPSAGVFHVMLYDSENTEKIKRNCLEFIIIGGAAAVAAIGQELFFSLAGQKIKLGLRKKIFSSLICKEFQWYDRLENDISFLCHRLSMDADCIQHVLCVNTGVVVQSITIYISAIIIGFLTVRSDFYPVLGVCVTIIPIIVLISYFNENIHKRHDILLGEKMESSSELCFEVFTSIHMCANLCLEQEFEDAYKQSLKAVSRYIFLLNTLSSFLYGLSQAAPWIFMVVLICLGLHFEKVDDDFESHLLLIELYIFGTISIGRSLALLPSFHIGVETATRIQNIIVDKQSHHFEAKRNQQIFFDQTYETPPTIDLVNIYFHYDVMPENVVLNGINLQIPPCSYIAIVGPSGCGKTTLANIMIRLLTTNTGFVFFDDKDITHLSTETITNTVSLVEHEPAIFDLTIKENITFGLDKDVTEEEIIHAARLSNLEEEVDYLENKFDTKFRTLSRSISHSFKKRIALARAILRNPKILILDDIITPFDTTVDVHLLRAIQRVRSKRTLIVFSQKLDLIQNADKIYVLSDGEIVEEGTDSSLMKQNGIYYDMYMTQKLLESKWNEGGGLVSDMMLPRRSIASNVDPNTSSRSSLQRQDSFKILPSPRKSSIVYGKFLQGIQEMNQANAKKTTTNVPAPPTAVTTTTPTNSGTAAVKGKQNTPNKEKETKVPIPKKSHGPPGPSKKT